MVFYLPKERGRKPNEKRKEWNNGKHSKYGAFVVGMSMCVCVNKSISAIMAKSEVMTFHSVTYLWMEFAISLLYFHFHFHYETKPFWMPMLAEDIRTRLTIKSATVEANVANSSIWISLDNYNTCFVLCCTAKCVYHMDTNTHTPTQNTFKHSSTKISSCLDTFDDNFINFKSMRRLQGLPLSLA